MRSTQVSNYEVKNESVAVLFLCGGNSTAWHMCTNVCTDTATAARAHQATTAAAQQHALASWADIYAASMGSPEDTF